MDRDALVRRNRQLAEAFHQAPPQHRLRRFLIQITSHFPFAPLTKGWNRVLFIRPDHLGDMLLATPAIRALKAARPYLEIHVLAGPWAASLLRNVDEVDLVLTVEFPGFNRVQQKASLLAPYFQLLRVSRQLRQIGYGHAVIMRPDHWWGAMLAHMAGISERIGYATEDVQPFLTLAHDPMRKHVIRQNLRLVEHWTGAITDEEVVYEFDVSEKERIDVNNYLRRCGISERQPIFCIHPGSGTWAKRWENERWAQVADTLTEQLDAQVVFTGGDHERTMVEEIAALMQSDSCMTAGELNLDQVAALYERATVVLGPDSGPLHLAAAVGVPTVTLYGPADPIEFGPWGDRDRHIALTSNIACRPCRVLDWGDDDAEWHPCVRDITIGDVLDAARRVVRNRLN